MTRFGPFARLIDAEREIGIAILAERGSANGVLADDTTIDRALLSAAIADSELPGSWTAEQREQAAKVRRRLCDKLDEANGLVEGAVQTARVARPFSEVPSALRWAALELFLYELYDQGRPDDVLERWQHAQEYLARVRSGEERIAGAVYCDDVERLQPRMGFGRLVRA